MESRNVTLTLDKAREFYNSGNNALKEIALQAFTKGELKTPKYSNIKTFEDAVAALGLCICDVEMDLDGLDNHGFEANTSEHLKAIYKLDIISKALNGGWKPSLIENITHYPFVRFYPAGQKAREAAASNGWNLGSTFMTDNEKYTLVGSAYSSSCVGLLGCKSREIAEHMSRYFAREIFEACYAQHVGVYEWV